MRGWYCLHAACNTTRTNSAFTLRRTCHVCGARTNYLHAKFMQDTERERNLSYKDPEDAQRASALHNINPDFLGSSDLVPF